MRYYLRLIQAFFLLTFCTAIASCSSMGGSGVTNLTSLPDNYTQVALLLPLHGAYAGPGKAIRDGFLAGYYNTGRGNLNVKVYDTSTSNNINKLYAQAIADGAQMVVGPLAKDDVANLMSHGDITVPTIALNYVNSNNPPNLFFEFGISPQNEATQVAAKANSAGLKNALVIAPQGSWGQSVVTSFTQQWQQSGGTVVGQLYYAPNMDMRSAVSNLLQVTGGSGSAGNPPRRNDFDSIFLVATPDMGRQIIPLLNYYYAGNVPVYSISMIYTGTQNVNYNRDMDGVTFDDIPWVFNSESSQLTQQNISQLWPANYKNYIRLYALGLDAFSLVKNLKQLPMGSSSGIAGNTGNLYLAPNHWIMQSFIWGKFKNGQAVQIG